MKIRVASPWFVARRVGVLLIGGLQFTLLLAGCGSNSGESPPVNGAKFTVLTDPPAEYALGPWTLVDKSQPQVPRLQWSQSTPGTVFRAQMSLGEGTNSAEFVQFGYDGLTGPNGDKLASDTRFCTDDCQGVYTVSIDTVQQKLTLDLDMKFDAGFATCVTPYDINFHPEDLSVEYVPCAKNNCQAAVVGCCCQLSLPCSGSVVRNNEQLCANPDFKVTKIRVGITANAELTRDVFQSP